jgi:hypothetical protein
MKIRNECGEDEHIQTIWPGRSVKKAGRSGERMNWPSWLLMNDENPGRDKPMAVLLGD